MSSQCRVSFTDSEGIEHAVEVPASSLYEAAVLALARFRKSSFTEATFGIGTQLTVRVRQPETEHTVSVGKLQAWIDGGAKGPNEQIEKRRLKKILDSKV